MGAGGILYLRRVHFSLPNLVAIAVPRPAQLLDPSNSPPAQDTPGARPARPATPAASNWTRQSGPTNWAIPGNSGAAGGLLEQQAAMLQYRVAVASLGTAADLRMPEQQVAGRPTLEAEKRFFALRVGARAQVRPRFPGRQRRRPMLWCTRSYQLSSC